MSEILLSLDPGTRKLGWALWGDETLIEWGVVKAAKSDALWSRIRTLVWRLRIYIGPEFTITSVACEDPQGFKDSGQRPLSLITGALSAIWDAPWYPYHQSTIKASCVLRGTPIQGRDKAAVRVVMESLYPQAAGADEDAIDAIAVGHTHLAHMREKAIEELA